MAKRSDNEPISVTPKRFFARAVLIIIGAVVAGFLLYAFVNQGVKSVGSRDATSPAASPSQDNLAGAQDQPSIAPTADSSAAAFPPDAALTPTPSQPESPPPLPTAEELTEARASITRDNNPPAAIDCSGASSVAASMVCNDAGLRSQNARLAPIYRTLVARATPDQRAKFAQEQDAWISQRDACDTQSCLANSYRQRIKAVTVEAWTQYNARNGSSIAPVDPSPSPSPKQPEYF